MIQSNPERAKDGLFRIGVISDTHGHLDPRVPGLFAGVDHIIHGGDIGLPWLILQLEQIAPVTAVAGNVDTGLDYKETQVLELAGRKFLVHHVVDVHSPAPALQRRIIRENPAVIIFGHSHKAFCETIQGTLYLNPGYAGKVRFNLPRSVAILECRPEGLSTQFKALP